MVLSRNMNEKFTFENFKISSENRLAFSTALCLAAGPGIEANPLIIYGPPGAGKTHLLYAIHREYAKNYPDKKILHVKAVHLGEWYFGEIFFYKDHKEKAENYLKTFDLLLVDDLDTIDEYYYQDEEPYPLTSTKEVMDLLEHPLDHDVKVVVVTQKPFKQPFKSLGFRKGFEVHIQPVFQHK